MKSITPFREARYLVETPYGGYFCDTIEEADRTREALIKGGRKKVSWRSMTKEEEESMDEFPMLKHL